MKPAISGTTAERANEPVGVIDIGSNSVRLLIYEGLTRNPSPQFNEKVLCGLGRSLSSTGKLNKVSVQSALQALRRFRAIATQVGVARIEAIATAAVRDARNAAAFVAQAEDICGGPIRVLSGKEEAKYAASGILSGFSEPDGFCGDLGGGSLELADIRHGKISKTSSLPLGGLRLIDRSKGDIKKASKYIDEQLAKVDWLSAAQDRAFYAIGGTWRAFAKVHMAHMDYPLRVTHGYTIPRDEAVQFAQVLQKLSPSSLEGMELINKARREVMPFGAALLQRIFQIIKPSALVVSAHGVREGLYYHMLPRHVQQSDPLLAAAADIALLSAKSSHYCHELCDWTDALFASSNLDESVEERRLRHAACLLSDIGWHAHPEYRDQQSLDLVAHSNLSGIDHGARIFIGLAVFYRYGGSDKYNQPALFSLADERTVKRAKILGAAFRLAHVISAGTPGVIYNAPIKMVGDNLKLDLAAPYNILKGQKLVKRLESLGGLLGCKASIDAATEGQGDFAA